MNKDEAMRKLKEKYGTLKKAAKFLGISYGYLANVSGGHATYSPKIQKKIENGLNIGMRSTNTRGIPDHLITWVIKDKG